MISDGNVSGKDTFNSEYNNMKDIKFINDINI